MTFTDTSSGSVVSRSWTLEEGPSSSRAAVVHAWTMPGFYRVTLTVGDGDEEATASRTVRVEAADLKGSCTTDDETLCLQDSRFAVRSTWWTAEGERRAARVAYAGTNQSGLFWFFDPFNWELLIKVLDGCRLNDHFWVYAASTTDVGYRIEVTDTVTGAVSAYEYEPGRAAPAITDPVAFPGSCGGGASSSSSTSTVTETTLTPAEAAPAADGTPAVTAAAASAGNEVPKCADGSSTLCVQGERYEVSVDWWTLDGQERVGLVAPPRTMDSGVFYFFDRQNYEVLIKVLDGCAVNDHHWVYSASATDVGFELTVTDTVTGASRVYTKQAGSPAPALTDAGAFPGVCRP